MVSDGVLVGEVGWFVNRGAVYCQRCGDTNYDDALRCLTCGPVVVGEQRDGFTVIDRRRGSGPGFFPATGTEDTRALFCVPLPEVPEGHGL